MTVDMGIAGMVTDGEDVKSLVAMPARCAARADAVRAYAETLELGQGTRDMLILARRISWDAHAAGDYPRPMLSDALDLSAAWPLLAEAMWHLVAGATILGPGCDCQPPAAHRDALVNLAVIVGSHEIRHPHE